MKILALVLATVVCACAAPFEIKEGDRVLLLGDALLERENTYGLLETRMHEQFPNVKFTVRNLSWSGETPKGWSRASFDAPEKGWERLKEQIAEVKPTVAILGFGMAASLQEMTDRSGDQTLNPDPVRYGAEPMSAGRFKKELGELMDAINASTPDKQPARFVLLSPIKHEDLRQARPGAPDPTSHNALLERYSKAIQELSKEHSTAYVECSLPKMVVPSTDNGIHLTLAGYSALANDVIARTLEWTKPPLRIPENTPERLRHMVEDSTGKFRGKLFFVDVREAVLRKNDLFFHQFRPANSTYLFGFRKHEQGRNAAEMPKFTPLIEAVDVEIDRLKRQTAAATPAPGAPAASAPQPQPDLTPLLKIVPGPRYQIGSLDSDNIDELKKALAMLGKDGAKSLRISADKSVPYKALEEALAAAKEAKIPDVAISTGSRPSLPLPNFTVADGLEITLWADTNLVGKPVGMNWDAAGRLWVACSPVYPQIAPGAHPEDKVVVIEDTDRDGKADKSTTFATDLLIAAGVAPDFGTAPIDANGKAPEPRISAAYVGASTELVRVEDTDGDGKGDTRRIIASGLGTEDTHHTIHTLRWGPDGRLYFNQSIYIHSHMETPYGMVRLNSGGICAYDPRSERIEVFARGFINTWGHAWDKWGQSFASDGAGFEGIHWIIPGAMYRTYEGARRILPSISPGTYPKYSGLEIIQSPLFPEDWQGNAITCDFRAHKITRFQINDLSQPTEPGKEPLSGYITKELPNPVTTSDSSFRPIDVKLGPDGALYIADWTNPIINHGEVDFRDPRRDHVNGRIWRVAPKGKAALKWEPITEQSALNFSDHARTKNQWNIDQARRFIFPKPRNLREAIGDVWQRELQEADAQLNDVAAAQIEIINFDAAEELVAGLKMFSFAAKNTSRHPSVRARAARQASIELARVVQHPTALAATLRDQDVPNELNSTEQALAASVKEMKAALEKARGQSGKAPQVLEAELQLKVTELQQIQGQIVDWERFLKATPAEREQGLIDAAFTHFAPFIRDAHPRVRVEAMRSIAKVPRTQSVSLILEAALNVPGGAAKQVRSEDKGTSQFNQPTFADTADPYYGYAAWLSVNDLAPQVMEWIEREATAANANDGASGSAGAPPAVAGASPGTPNVANRAASRDGNAATNGTNRTHGTNAGVATGPTRDAKIAYALQCLRPEQSSALLSKVLQKRGLPKDGSGPWIELIGQAGGPAEMAMLLGGIFANVKSSDGKPFAEPSLAFSTPEANRRAAAALVTAARRGLKPANIGPEAADLVTRAPEEAAADIIRLAGLWRINVPDALIGHIRTKDAPATLKDAVFESLRALGTNEAATYLAAFLAPPQPAVDSPVLRDVLQHSDPATRRRALAALATVRADAALGFLSAVLKEADAPGQLPLWRELFSSEPFTKALLKNVPQLTKEQAGPALRAARELGKRGEKLVAALTPLAGEAPATPVTHDIAALVDSTKKNGNPVEGELVYRRVALTCTVCHAIGGAGGKVGPDLGTIGASAPLDYIIESTVNPAAKVKEGFHAIAVTTKDGKTLSGTVAKESDTALTLRDMTGAEQSVEKNNIKERTNIGSLMPAGLTATLNHREQANLFAFMAQLGKTGPFDASKASVARVWRVYPGDQVEQVVAGKADATKAAPVYSLVDGRVTKELMEIPVAIAGDQPTLVATARFALVGGGQRRLHLAGITKAWLNGAPLAIASDPNPVVELPAGEHMLVIKLDTKTLPAHFRAEVPDGRFLME